jgi:hypothetical protein
LPATQPDEPFPGIFTVTYARTRKIIPGGDTILPVYRCPTSELPSFAEGYLGSDIHRNGYATSDYKGCNGGNDLGIFYKVADGWNRAKSSRVRPQDVTDGLSKTIAIGESAYYLIEGNATEDWPIWLGAPGTDEATLFKTDVMAPINCFVSPKTIDRFRVGPGGPIDDDCAFSWHQNGAFFAFADGAVHFIEESIDIETYERLGTNNDGYVIDYDLK